MLLWNRIIAYDFFRYELLVWFWSGKLWVSLKTGKSGEPLQEQVEVVLSVVYTDNTEPTRRKNNGALSRLCACLCVRACAVNSADLQAAIHKRNLASGSNNPCCDLLLILPVATFLCLHIQHPDCNQSCNCCVTIRGINQTCSYTHTHTHVHTHIVSPALLFRAWITLTQAVHQFTLLIPWSFSLTHYVIMHVRQSFDVLKREC